MTKSNITLTGGININNPNDFLKEEFFIIESTDLKSVKSYFYGYGFSDDEVIRQDNFSSDLKLDAAGSYVSVNVDGDYIYISQDYLGSYGLYLYQIDDYFAVSNSFLKLVEYLSKSDKTFTINEDYANYYLAAAMSSLVPDETLVNEIKMLKHNVIVKIDITNKSISYERIEYGEGSVSLDSSEGIAILDEWHDKWVGRFRNIFASNHLTVDLSGGFDSRVVAALWLSSGINLDNLTINSSHHNERFDEDFEIASQIADYFDFKLNNDYKRERIPCTLEESINTPLYVKFGFHKKRYFPIYKNAQPNFRISGHCGGTIRNYPNIPVSQYVDEIIERASDYENHVEDSTRRLFSKKIDELSEIYGLNKNSKRLSSILYRESRNRHHFGKAFVEAYLKNWITLAPLSDALLSKLKITTDECDDDLLIITLIFARYCPELLNFKVEGGRKFNEKTIEYANMLNEKYPREIEDLDVVEGPEFREDIVNDKAVLYFGQHALLFKDIFTSANFIKDFEKYFSKKSYKFIRNTIYKDTHYLQDVHSSIDILKIHEYIDFNHSLNNNSIGSWFESYPIVSDDEFEMDLLMDKYRTLRIDIINKGSEDNNFDVIEYDDDDLKHTVPDWFNKNEGIGHVFKTQKSKLNLKIRIINDGEITIKLRAENVKDANGNHFPVYVDCCEFKVNREVIIDEHTLISLEGFKFKKEVSDDDVISLDIDWMPFNESSVYNLKDVDSLTKDNKNLKKKLKALEEENEEMRKILETRVFDFGNLMHKIRK